MDKRQAKTLREAIDDDNVVIIYVMHVLCGRYDLPIAARRVVVATIELIHDEGPTIAAHVLDVLELRVADDLACRVTWIACQQNPSTTCCLFPDQALVDMPAVVLGQWNWDWCETAEQGEQLVVGGIVWDEEALTAN